MADNTTRGQDDRPEETAEPMAVEESKEGTKDRAPSSDRGAKDPVRGRSRSLSPRQRRGRRSSSRSRSPRSRSRSRSRSKSRGYGRSTSRSRSPRRRRSRSPRYAGGRRRGGGGGGGRRFSRSRSRSRSRSYSPRYRGRRSDDDDYYYSRHARARRRGEFSPSRRARQLGLPPWEDLDGANGSFAGAGGSRRKEENEVMSLREFQDSLSGDFSGEEVKAKYDDYVAEQEKKRFRQFFDDHKDEEWFKEKYEPQSAEARSKERLEKATEAANKFLEVLAEDRKNYAAKAAEGNSETGEVTETTMEIETEAEDVFPSSKTVFLKGFSTSITRQQIQEWLGGAGEVSVLYLSDPVQRKHLRQMNRQGWARFGSEESANKALKDLSGSSIGDQRIFLGTIKPRTKTTPDVASSSDRLEKDLKQATELIKVLDKENSLSGNALVEEEDAYLTSLTTGRRLDLLIKYLKTVHMFCYYCGEEFADEEELYARCGSNHYRGVKKGASVVKDEQNGPTPWETRLDGKIKDRLEKKKVERKLVSEPSEEFIEKTLEEMKEKNVVKVADEKYRCGLCSKLFKGSEYVQKHLIGKHDDLKEKAEAEAKNNLYFESYMNHPHRFEPPQANAQSAVPDRRHSMGGYGDRRGGGDRYSGGGGYQWGGYQPTHMRGGYGGYGGYGGRDGGYGGRGYGMAVPRAPPPGMAPDPRQLRQYVDLDAPEDGGAEIDYRRPNYEDTVVE